MTVNADSHNIQFNASWSLTQTGANSDFVFLPNLLITFLKVSTHIFLFSVESAYTTNDFVLVINLKPNGVFPLLSGISYMLPLNIAMGSGQYK